MNEWTKSRFEVVVTSYGRNKNRDDETKNIAAQVLKYNSTNFHWLNRKLDLELTMSESGKQFLKKTDQKIKKQKINIKMPHNDKKPQARNGNFVETKNTRSRMNYEWNGKTI